MDYHKTKLFSNFKTIQFGLSKKNREVNDPFSFNLSKSIGDDNDNVENNRIKFFSNFNMNMEQVVLQKQIHSDIINIVDKNDMILEGDALITNKKNLALAVSTADCTNIYLYDSQKQVIAAVHSGWVGTEKKILEKTIICMKSEFNCNSENIYAYIAPSISQINYEVGTEFKKKFDIKYLKSKNGKFLLDLKQANMDMLLQSNIPLENIDVSNICSFENNDYHSYRRDKDQSGRALGLIVMK